MFSDYADCSKGKIGPQCLISCEIDLESYFDCKETAICYKDGCTCPPGYLGSSCINCKFNLLYY